MNAQPTDRRPAGWKHFVVIGCEVLFREVCFLSASCPHRLDHVWLSQGLHDLGTEKMRTHIQAAVDAVPTGACDAICLAFALCNNGIVGLEARDIPLVVPKDHDCITLFLGSRERYREHFDAAPGTYYLTSGWLERDDSEVTGEEGQSIFERLGLDFGARELRERYGEENAAYVAEMLGGMLRHYSRIAYIDMGFEDGLGFRDVARRAAVERGWEFELVRGDLGLLRRLLWGEWDEDMLVVRPGERIEATFDEDLVRAAPAASRG